MAKDIPLKFQQTVQSELHPFERILFAAQPIAARLALQALPILLFAIPWTIFSIFWMYMASEPMRSAPSADKVVSIAFPLFGLPFVLIGFAMLSAPLWAFRLAGKTLYVLTNERAIIFTGGRAMRIESIGPDRLKDSVASIRQDGSGDLTFQRDVEPSYYYGRRYRPRLASGFIGLPDVRNAKQQLEKMLEEKSGQQPV